MIKPFLFMSGETTVTMPLAYSSSNWDFTAVATKLCYDNGFVRRCNRAQERLSGLIMYCDVEDKAIEVNNLTIAIGANIPCWPDPNAMKAMVNRHEVMRRCIELGYATNDVLVANYSMGMEYDLKYPCVVKTGTSHCGIDKFIANNSDELVKILSENCNYGDLFTAEPFYKGRSARVLVIGETVISYYIDNDESWVKNSPGAVVTQSGLDSSVISHATDVASSFGIDVAGVDYIISDDGFHFLEVNQFPGLSWSPDSEEISMSFIRDKMREIEFLSDKAVKYEE